MTSTDLVTMPESNADRKELGLLSLPSELLYLVTSFMGQKERRRLMLTCWGLHKCLQKELYENDGKDDHHALWSACVKNMVPTANIILTFNPAIVNRRFQGEHKTRTRLGRNQKRQKDYDLGATPLFVAANRGSVSVVKKLLESSADVNLANPVGIGPTLWPNGTTLSTIAGWFPVHAAMEIHAFDMQKRILKLLVAHGADINQRALDPGTITEIPKAEPPIFAALEPRFPDMAPFKVEGGSHIQYKKELGTSLEQQAFFFEALVRMGADPNLRDCNGRTPLMRCMDILLSYTPKFTYDSRYATLQEKDEQHDLVHKLVFCYVTVLAHHGADMNAVVQEPPVAGQNVPPTNRRGRKSVLHLACNLPNKHDTMARRLVKFGSNMNAVDSHGMTPIFEYCETPPDSTNTFVWLMNKGANVNHKDNSGQTPLHHAIINRPKSTIGADKVVELLVQHGADITVRDNDGKTAEDLATQDRDPEAKTFLRKERLRHERTEKERLRREGAEKDQFLVKDGRKAQPGPSTAKKVNTPNKTYMSNQSNKPNQFNTPNKSNTAKFHHAQTSGHNDRQQQRDSPRRQGPQSQQNHGTRAAQQGQRGTNPAEGFQKPHGQQGPSTSQKTYTSNKANTPNQSNKPNHFNWHNKTYPPNNTGAQAVQKGKWEHTPAEGSQKPHGQPGPSTTQKTYTPNKTNTPNQSNKSKHFNAPNKSNAPNKFNTSYKTNTPNSGYGRGKGRGRGNFTWTPNKDDGNTKDNKDAEKVSPVPPSIEA